MYCMVLVGVALNDHSMALATGSARGDKSKLASLLHGSNIRWAVNKYRRRSTDLDEAVGGVGDKTAATYASWSLDDAAARVMSQRIALLTQLRDLSPDDWNARAIHDTFGDMDVRELVLQVLAHDEEHRASFVVSDSG